MKLLNFQEIMNNKRLIMQKQIENNNVKKNKNKKQKVQLNKEIIIQILIQVQQAVQFGTDHYSNIRKLAQMYIKPLTFQNVQELNQTLAITLQEHNNKEKQNKKTILQQYVFLDQILRQVQVATPVSDTFFENYMKMFTLNQNITKADLLSIWMHLPYRNLEDYLKKFALQQQYQNIDPQLMEKELISSLVDNRVPQCCQYYKLYFSKDKPLITFQSDHLIPKLQKSDHIFSPHVLNLMKVNDQLKMKLIDDIDASFGLKLIESLDEDPTEYPKLNNFILRQHYKSIWHEYHKTWQIMQDKISFSKKFIEYFCEDIIMQKQLRYVHDGSQVSKIDIKNSILLRNELISQQQFQASKSILIQNKFYTQDIYGNAETILHPNLDKNNYLQLQQYGISQDRIYFVDNLDTKQFHILKEQLRNCQEKQEYVGFDSQFRCIQTKYNQHGVSIIQLATKKYGFILDFLKLETNKHFMQFMKAFLTNPNLLKIGHTVDSDLKQLSSSLTLQVDPKGFIDVSKIFKKKYPQSKYSSLAYICQAVLGKKLSKYEQRSNWNRRPLKKTQIHYGVSDAYFCMLSLQKLQGNESLTAVKQLHINKNNHQMYEIIRTHNLVYSKKYEYLLQQKMPKFLIDNMMKRLCSIMRNVGIDTQFISVRDHQLAMSLAQKQQRIIVTRDSKFFNKKQQSVPLFMLDAGISDSEEMFTELVKQFKLNLKKYSTLSRCVKCNCDVLEDFSREQALQILNFKHDETQIKQFWKCQKCKQIYWEGDQFRRAEKQFDKLKKKK